MLNHLTLDGVMQGPGGPDEDTRDGFRHGGWAVPGNDDVMARFIAERFSQPDGGLLLGRRSYEQMLTHWNDAGGPFRERLNAARKYVASSRPDTQPSWPNSALLYGDVPSAVAALKRQRGGSLIMMGSGELIRSLLPHDLIDEYLLMIHPLVLGSGRRLFADGGTTLRLQLSESTSTTTGVVIGTYHPASNG